MLTSGTPIETCFEDPCNIRTNSHGEFAEELSVQGRKHFKVDFEALLAL